MSPSRQVHRLPARARAGLRGAAAGAIAAGVWSAAEPVVARVLRTGFTDARLLGRWITPDGPWRAIGVTVHVTSGAVFGAVFGALSGRGPKVGALAAMAEYMASWPGMAVADRWHPDRRSGEWPPLVVSGRVALQEALMHLVFGAVLGLVSDALHRGAAAAAARGDARQGAKTAS